MERVTLASLFFYASQKSGRPELYVAASSPKARRSGRFRGLRRAELLGLGTEDFQVREEHCVIADLVGKGKHILPFRFRSGRNALSMSGPRPLASNVGAVFRRLSRMDDIWGDSITPKAIWAASRNSATR
jgi:hypothetical protein